MYPICLVVSLLVATVASLECPQPDPAGNFSAAAFGNVAWKEIGKYQTFNPFEKGCECTEIYYSPQGSKIFDTCQKNGKTTNVSAFLVPVRVQPSGVFDEVFEFGPKNSTSRLTIVELGNFGGEDYAIEFDCNKDLLGINYCFHVFTKTGIPPAGLVEQVQGVAQKLGLNPENLEWQTTKQGDGCNY
eukprot:m.12677 g.12677  ORF g.12677 m.12677 type:complete len:187 (+) comp4709_c0_seq1:170-730(+)